MRAFDLGALIADIVILVLLAGGVAGVVFLVKAKPKPEGQLPTAPNWYPDPADPEVLRYFDGRSWTGATRPRTAQPGA